ncbi:hypothetical protein SC22_17785 [Bacillus sp. A053]|uniref:lysozyme inhibitor LprI family protein n=1 Tax=unclassified Bacillus (in: firmicutes) TaxID=185979 RepID=UPI000589FCC2|nr:MULTISPECIES: lysozyme inhibitor LprI family protein [unclassified Bacillus (in: firmicutes)]ASB59988.1 hypothetical protein CDO84_02840 [Bacillus sp. MD-5]KIH38702.1 hypothetical protein SC22_17785 [Bacillus sp. A053]
MSYKLGALLLSVLFLLSACSDSGASDKEQEKQAVKKESVAKLTEQEVKSALKNDIDSIFNAFDKAGTENGWSTANKADFSKLRPSVLPYATETFADQTLKDLAGEYYCECDAPFQPGTDFDVRFTYKQNKNKIEASSIDPATELNNMGTSWTFELVKEDGDWKINKWDSKSLQGDEIKLTKEEAKTILSRNGETAEFVKSYESKAAGGTAYLFNVKSSHGERQAAISSKDTSLVSDNENETEAAEQETAQKTAETASPDTVDTQSSGQTTGSTKTDYVAKLSAAEKKEKHNDYQSDYQMIEDYGYNYQMWDGLLNEIYGVLQNQLSASDMAALKGKQRQWIKDRDAAAQKRYDEEGGGSLSRVVQTEELAKQTKERCYELVNTYMK